MNRVELTGRVTRDPELRHVGGSGFPILSINIAVDDAEGRWNKETRKTEYESGFYQVEVKGPYAEALTRYIVRGANVYVVGSLSQWKKTGNDGGEPETKTRISATMVVPLTGEWVNGAPLGQAQAPAPHQAQQSGWDSSWGPSAPSF